MDGARAVLEAVDFRGWTSGPGPFPIALLGFAARFGGESAHDHLGRIDFEWLFDAMGDRGVESALDLIRAIELGDSAAAERTRARLAEGGGARSQPTVSLVGAQRMYDLMAPLLGAHESERFRAVIRSFPGSSLLCGAAASLAATGLDAGEDLPWYQDAMGAPIRVFLRLALQRPNVDAEALLAEARVCNAQLLGRLPWDEAVDRHEAGTTRSYRRLGRAVLTSKAACPEEGKGYPRTGRATVKLHPDARRAQRAFESSVKKLPPEGAPRWSEAALDERLWWAAERDRELIRDLIEEGARPTHRGYHGMSPLLRAAWRSTDPGEACRLLLEAGADPLATSEHGDSALDLVAGNTYGRHGATSAARRLLDAGTRCRPRALHDGLHQRELFPFLASAGADPHAVVDGHSALEVARARRLPRTLAALQRLT